MGLPSGDAVFDYRDRAIIEVFVYSGARIGRQRVASESRTSIRTATSDFHAPREGRQAPPHRPRPFLTDSPGQGTCPVRCFPGR